MKVQIVKYLNSKGKVIEMRKNNLMKIQNYTIEAMTDKHYELIIKNK